jgi:hypothetical protein
MLGRDLRLFEDVRPQSEAIRGCGDATRGYSRMLGRDPRLFEDAMLGEHIGTQREDLQL